MKESSSQDETSFEDLCRFADGETDDAEARRIATAVRNEPHLGGMLSDIGQADARARQGYDAFLDAPVPEDLEAVVNRCFNQKPANEPIAKPSFFPLYNRMLPLAASLLIAVLGVGVGLSGGIYIAERHSEDLMIKLEERRLADRVALTAAVQEALETVVSGSEVRFRSERTGASGKIVPVRTYKSRSNHWCREFEETIERDGVIEQRVGIACRDAENTWRRLETTIKGPPDRWISF